MRLIPWNDELVEETLKYYSFLYTFCDNSFKRLLGNVAESLVEAYYGAPIHFEDEPDDGYDFILDGAKIDVKNHCNNINYFEHPNNNTWTVKYYKELNADFYLFTELDYENKQIALIGYLSKEELMNSQRFSRGDYFNNFRIGSDCFMIYYNQLHLIY